MDVKDLIERLREAAGALDGTALRVSTSKFDTQIIAELLLSAADELGKAAEGQKAVVRGRGSGKPMVELAQLLAAQEAAPEPVTNGDRIRAMTDEELVRSQLSEAFCDMIPQEDCLGSNSTCRECLIKWLGSPAALPERDALQRAYEGTRQIADRRAWDEPSRTMADICGQEDKDGQ